MQSYLHWKPFYCTEDPSRNKTNENVGDSSERTNKVETRETPYVPKIRRCHPTPPHQYFRPVPMGDTADLERLRAGTPAPQAAWAATPATASPQPWPQETFFDSVLFHPKLSHRYHGAGSSPYERRAKPNRDTQNGKLIPQPHPSCVDMFSNAPPSAPVPQRLPVEPASEPRRLPRQPSEPPASRATPQGIRKRRRI